MANNMARHQPTTLIPLRAVNFNAPLQPNLQPMPGVPHPRSMSMPMPFGPQGPQHQGRVEGSQLMPASRFQFQNNQVPAGPSPHYQPPVSAYQGPNGMGMLIERR